MGTGAESGCWVCFAIWQSESSFSGFMSLIGKLHLRVQAFGKGGLRFFLQRQSLSHRAYLKKRKAPLTGGRITKTIELNTCATFPCCCRWLHKVFFGCPGWFASRYVSVRLLMSICCCSMAGPPLSIRRWPRQAFVIWRVRLR